MATELERAELTVRKLSEARKDLLAKAEEIGVERQALSYDAAVGNKQAKAKLTDLNKAAAMIQLDIENAGNALVVANEKLKLAQDAEAREQERERAGDLRNAVQEFADVGQRIDATLAELADLGHQFTAAVRRVHACGSPFPTAHQVEVLCGAAVKTALLQTPWRTDPIAPGQRQKMADLIEGWQATILRNISHLLDDQAA
jgi:hypothetical protein